MPSSATGILIATQIAERKSRNIASIKNTSTRPNAPFDITTCGSYYVTGCLTATVDGIRVMADDVTIDLNGFTISTTGAAIRTYQPQAPPARTVPGASGSEGICINSIVASGVVINGGSVQHSILFPQVRVGDEAVIHNAILFSGVRVGPGADLQRCIIDKDVVVPDGARIGFDIADDAARFTVSDDGVVVVPRGYHF